jgi:hypothetical protein
MPKKPIAQPPRRHAPPPAVLHEEVLHVLAARGEERENLLLRSDHIAAIVPRLPPEELLFTLREAGADAAVEILSHARASQVSFLLDLELWDKGALRRDRAPFWIEKLEACGDARLSHWLRALEDYDLLLLLGAVTRAAFTDEEGHAEEVDEHHTAFTLDGVHSLTMPSAVEPQVRKMLAILKAQDAGRYFRVVEGLLAGIDAEMEEEALRARTSRIAERGFLDFEDAQEIYIPLTHDQFEEKEARSSAPMHDPDGYEAASPLVPLATDGPTQRIQSVLARVTDPDDAEAIIFQLARLTHKVIAADGLDPADVHAYRVAARKVAGFLTIGLEMLCGHDEAAMAERVALCWLEHLFRLGWGRVLEAGKAARTMVRTSWPSSKLERLLLLDSPLPEVLDGLLRRRPLATDLATGKHRDFENLAEVEAAEHLVVRADVTGRYLMSAIQFHADDLAKVHSQIEDDNLKGSTLFLTALANAALKRGFQFAPLSRADVHHALAALWVEGVFPHRVRPEFLQSALAWSEGFMELPETDRTPVAEFLGDCIRLLEDQFGTIPAGELPDPRFLRGLWIV